MIPSQCCTIEAPHPLSSSSYQRRAETHLRNNGSVMLIVIFYEMKKHVTGPVFVSPSWNKNTLFLMEHKTVKNKDYISQHHCSQVWSQD